jgi:hypothetical protein
MDNERENRLLTSVEALTDIDDALISEAFGAKKRPSPLRYVAAAAAVLLILCGAFAAIRLIRPSDPNDITVMRPSEAPGFTQAQTNAPGAPTEAPTPQPTEYLPRTEAPETTGAPVPTDEPDFTPQTTQTDAPKATAAPASSPTPKASPKATGTPNAASTPKATGKPAGSPTPGPTQAPADATNEPVCYDFDSEEAFVSAIHAAGSGSVLGGFTHYYVPGALPGGAKLNNISVYDRDVIFGYSGGYELDWLYNSDPDDYLAQIQSHYQGHWEGGLYIVETGGLRAFWKQDGQAFKASFPSGTDITVIKAFCAAKRVNV